MAKPAVPESDSKIGAKIDFLVKHLSEHLKARGFRRRARVIYREHGDGPHRCVQLIGFQADKWNQGQWGKFTINLGVCFPALLDLQKDLPGLEWISQHTSPYDLAFGPGGFQARLSDALGEEYDPRWPESLRAKKDFWAEIDAKTDLGCLAEGIDAAVLDLALPWIERRSTLASFGSIPGSALGAPGPREKLLAAMLTGNTGLARRCLLEAPAHRIASDAKQFNALLLLVTRYGVDATGITWAEPAADPMRQRRNEKVGALKGKHLARVEVFLSSGAGLSGNEDGLLDAWVDEDAANQLAETVNGFRLWRVLSEATLDQRRALLCRLLRRLPECGPSVESTISSVWATYDNYHVSAWSKLAIALLENDNEACDFAHAAALLDALATAAPLVTEGMMNDEFKAPVSAVINWLDKRCTPDVRFGIRSSAQSLFDAIRIATTSRSSDRLSQMPPRDLLGEDLADQLSSLYTPESRADCDRLYTQCPERSYATADRQAILKLKRWLRADKEGRVPLQIESDDWGSQLTYALQEMEPKLHGQVMQLLEWFDATATTRPGKRWLSELDARRSQMEEADTVEWLNGVLPRFAITDLKHFQSAPGFLAFPGETSERVLLGLIHLAGCIDSVKLVAALGTVAEAAFKVVPDQRMRAYGVGAACLGPLARQPRGRDALGALRRAIKQKNVKAAIDKALAQEESN